METVKIKEKIYTYSCIPPKYIYADKTKRRPQKKPYNIRFKIKWSGRQDLNLQPLGPKPSALPS